MEQFRLDKVVAVMGVQNRIEKHGPKKNEPAVTLSFKASVPADMLRKFDPQLKASYFRKEIKADEPVRNIADEGTKEKTSSDDLTRLKFPKADNVIAWDEIFSNYHTMIDFGLGEDSAIKIDETNADAWTMTLNDGGNMMLAWNVAAHPTEPQAGKLYALNGSEVTVTLTPPQDGKNDGQADMIGGGRK